MALYIEEIDNYLAKDCVSDEKLMAEHWDKWCNVQPQIWRDHILFSNLKRTSKT